MKAIRAARRIAAPLERVWAGFTDPVWAGEQLLAVRSVELLTDGQMRPGTRWRETRMLFGRPAQEVLEVTAFEPMRRYAVSAHSSGMAYETVYRFAPVGESVSDVEVRFSARPTSSLSRAVSGVLSAWTRRSAARSLARDLQDVAEAIERERASEGGPA